MRVYLVNFVAPSNPKTKREASLTRNKRAAPYYCQNSVLYRNPNTGVQYWVGCVTGCCKTVCACNINYYYSVTNGVIQCSWTISACPPQVPDQLVYYDGSCRGPNGVNCPNANHACSCLT